MIHNLQQKRKARNGRCVGSQKARLGVATIETAVTLPLLVFLTFGSLEISNAIFLRQSLAIASYEGARTVTKPAGTEALARTRIAEVMSARGINNFTITVTPPVPVTAARGTKIAVVVSCGSSTLSYSPFQFFTNKNILSSTTMAQQ